MNHERPTPATGCLCTKVSFTCVESQVPPLPSSNVVERVLILEGGSFSTCRAFRGFCLDSLSLPSLPCQHILVCFARALRTATPPRDVQPCSAYARLSPKARGCRRLQAFVSAQEHRQKPLLPPPLPATALLVLYQKLPPKMTMLKLLQYGRFQMTMAPFAKLYQADVSAAAMEQVGN